MAKKSKVFSIGLHKTGTNSIKYSLEILGFICNGPDIMMFDALLDKNFTAIEKTIKKWDAFKDDPWYMMYEYLNENHPDAKFILTVRDEESWYNSVVNFYHNKKKAKRVRAYFYGSDDPITNKEAYLNKYQTFNADVKEYFKGKPNFLCIENIATYDFNDFCDFLEVENTVGLSKFPHRLKGAYTDEEKKLNNRRRLTRNFFGLKQSMKRFVRKIIGNNRFQKSIQSIRYAKSYFKRF